MELDLVTDSESNIHPSNEIEVESIFVETAEADSSVEEQPMTVDMNELPIELELVAVTSSVSNETACNESMVAETNNCDEETLLNVEMEDSAIEPVEAAVSSSSNQMLDTQSKENTVTIEMNGLPLKPAFSSDINSSRPQNRLYKSYFVASTFRDITHYFNNKTVCVYCDGMKFNSDDSLKEHIRTKHYANAVFCLINNKQVCIFPCRKNCEIVRANVVTKTQNYPHFHCPLCKKLLGNITVQKKHLQRSNPCHGHGRIFILDAKKLLAREQSKHVVGNDLLKNAVDEIGIPENDGGNQSDNSLSDIHPENISVQLQSIDDEQLDDTCLKKTLPQNNEELHSNKQNSIFQQSITRLYKSRRVHESINRPSNSVVHPPISKGMLKRIHVDGVSKEDQIFAASLAVEMKKFTKKEKTIFKMKVLTFLHEALLD